MSSNWVLYQMPNVLFDDVWSLLHFENSLREELLQELTNTIVLEREGLNASLHDWTGLVLLHGSPGSGKTSLCRALAQKLAIRSSEIYRSFYLVEVNANNLYSKWFGESGKNIAKSFRKIYSMARDPDDFICVLIDEIETIAGSRQQSAESGEVGDALRATNQFLTALDKLRFHSNVLLFCTSNLMTTLDAAFLSRVDIIENIGASTPEAAYEILRSCLNDLISKQQICFDETFGEENSAASEGSMEAIDRFHGYQTKDAFPKYIIASFQHHIHPNSLASKLLDISKNCAGLSGRLLRRIPRRAVSRYTFGKTRSAVDVLKAMSLLVDKERQQRCKEVEQQARVVRNTCL
ncbi:uncharacterized protein PV09_07118 [Verruconis gallopava]|uniref:AAA+ ATPase domain-containing protein n=1 Tax=Verruconis gallopava TaxID=253628 RepID=A0A0D1XGL2_9PEZI|nr:uncharacterized protein PV09_07118 [Verruconis gallopava]KIW01346.1 hypothetical protein PV09_07118 [Verruconis gallopava]